MAQTTNSKSDKVIGFLSLWIARLALSTLAFTGAMYLMGSVDDIIRYPLAGTLVAFLVKETL